jgi:excisionase family DNA binding protein
MPDTATADPNAGWLTIREASRRLGRHENTIRNMVDDGRLPSRRRDNGWRQVSEAAVETLAHPQSPYLDGVIVGWFAAVGAAGKCGAHNADRPQLTPADFALCIRERGHTGMHDDTWRPWGDRFATADENFATSGADRRRLLELRDRFEVSQP